MLSSRLFIRFIFVSREAAVNACCACVHFLLWPLTGASHWNQSGRKICFMPSPLLSGASSGGTITAQEIAHFKLCCEARWNRRIDLWELQRAMKKKTYRKKPYTLDLCRSIWRFAHSEGGGGGEGWDGAWLRAWVHTHARACVCVCVCLCVHARASSRDSETERYMLTLKRKKAEPLNQFRTFTKKAWKA